MKSTLALFAVLGLAACDVHTSPPSGGSTTVVTPGAEKTVEHNTTVVKPEAPAPTKTETNTTVTPSGTSSTTTTR
jgi:hypothetical protein